MALLIAIFAPISVANASTKKVAIHTSPNSLAAVKASLYIPPREVRDLRELLRYRAALVRLQTAVKNRVHGILLKHGFPCPYADAFGVQGRAWLAALDLRPVYQQALTFLSRQAR